MGLVGRESETGEGRPHGASAIELRSCCPLALGAVLSICMVIPACAGSQKITMSATKIQQGDVIADCDIPSDGLPDSRHVRIAMWAESACGSPTYLEIAISAPDESRIGWTPVVNNINAKQRVTFMTPPVWIPKRRPADILISSRLCCSADSIGNCLNWATGTTRCVIR
jgi:hypothetical protein